MGKDLSKMKRNADYKALVMKNARKEKDPEPVTPERHARSTSMTFPRLLPVGEASPTPNVLSLFTIKSERSTPPPVECKESASLFTRLKYLLLTLAVVFILLVCEDRWLYWYTRDWVRKNDLYQNYWAFSFRPSLLQLLVRPLVRAVYESRFIYVLPDDALALY